ncbi:unnamed protein product [Nippostrongylus brasiliensis]|uniref:G1/S-specific cyclin-E (inferred by orthology to a C. elegans protein) n=1 Tax=Nippostrongylus brasiliensis TaxID=27835 RepID=A0A0N4YHX5_NIPBR|nr:unnamed protein product [Nippostrongylus brasiliensis]
MYHQKDAPPQLTALRCSGIGSPKKIWGLLCRKDELIRPTHLLLEKHPDLAARTRSILVDWMMEVCACEKQHRETFHLAVDYVDRFLATFEGIKSHTFQLVGTSALFLASKYEVITSICSLFFMLYCKEYRYSWCSGKGRCYWSYGRPIVPRPD